MGIVRVAKNNNYVVMNRTALNDKRLSWKAKGIMAYMLSMPDDWVFYMDELVTHASDGKDSFRSGFNELKKCGYVERKPIKDEETKKIIRWETIVHEVPLKQGEPDAEKPQVEKPYMENPEVEKPQVENPPLLSTDINQVLNKPNTDNNSTTTNTADRSQEIFQTVQENIRYNLSPIEVQTIEYWLKDYPHDLILEAIRRAVLSNRATLRYIETILKDWQHKRITNLAEVERDDADFKQKRGVNSERSQRSHEQSRRTDEDDFSL